MYSSIKLRFCCLSDVGKCRDNNEDNYIVGLVKPNEIDFYKINNPFTLQVQEFEINQNQSAVFGLADGMGGANAGEVASQIAMNTLELKVREFGKIPKSDNERVLFLQDIILKAHQNILKEAKHDASKKGMGTTAVLSALTTEGLTISWSGDSRFYALSPKSLDNKDHRLNLDRLSLISRDHSLVWDFVEDGEISAEEARVHHLSHVITQSLGSGTEKPNPESRICPISIGEKFLICSDGLNGMLQEAEIEEILMRNSSLNETLHELINKANEAGGYDNITLILIEIIDLVESIDMNHGHSNIMATTASQPLSFQRKKRSKSNVFLLLGLIASIIYLSNFLVQNTKADIISKWNALIQDKKIIDTVVTKSMEDGSKDHSIESMTKVIEKDTYINKSENILDMPPIQSKLINKGYEIKQEDNVLIKPLKNSIVPRIIQSTNVDSILDNQDSLEIDTSKKF